MVGQRDNPSSGANQPLLLLEKLERLSFRPMRRPADRSDLSDWSKARISVPLRSVCCPGLAIAPNLVYDMISAATSTPAPPGSRFEEIPHHQQWKSWLRRRWHGTITDLGGSRTNLERARLLLSTLAVTLPSESRTDDGRSREEMVEASIDRVDKNPAACWQIGKGESLLKAVVDDLSVRDLVGQSALLEAAGGLDRCDPCVLMPHHELGPMSPSRSLVGSTRGGDRAQVIEFSSGEFLRRRPGSLPENLGRLSPLELLYAVDAEELFNARVAESILDQRYFKATKRSDQCATVQVEVVLCDSMMLHQWAGSGAAISRYRKAMVELIRRVIQVDDDPGLRIQLSISHEMLGKSGSEPAVARAVIHDDLMQRWRRLNSDELAVRLSEKIPSLFSQSPIGHPVDSARDELNTAGNADRHARICLVDSVRYELRERAVESIRVVKAYETDQGPWCASEVVSGSPNERTDDRDSILGWLIQLACGQAEVAGRAAGPSSKPSIPAFVL